MSELIDRAVVAQSRDELALQLAQSIADLLRDDIATQGRASLVVSGGSTPKPLFKALSQQSLDWSKVAVTLADERWVPIAHPDSNETLVKENLLINEAASATFVSLYLEGVSPQQAPEQVDKAVAQMLSPFSVVVLGMGDDGHTASLFPDAPELESAMDPEQSRSSMMMHPPSVPQARISLTLRQLLDSQRLFLHITGEGKREVLARALAAGDTPGLPIARVASAAGLALTLYWAA